MMVTCSPRTAKRQANSERGIRCPGVRYGITNISRGRDETCESMVTN